jgi:hypothetical protein
MTKLVKCLKQAKIELYGKSKKEIVDLAIARLNEEELLSNEEFEAAKEEMYERLSEEKN